MGTKKAPAPPPRSFKVELALPPSDLSANKSVHHFAKNDAFQAYKRAADLLYRMAKLPRIDGQEPLRFPIRITARFYCYKGHPFAHRFYMPRDYDNAVRSLKAAIDGLKTARIVPDDSIKYVKYADVEIFSRKPEHQNRMGVDLIIEEAV